MDTDRGGKERQTAADRTNKMDVIKVKLSSKYNLGFFVNV